MAERGRGAVTISPLINRADSDFKDLEKIAGLFADMGRDVKLTPKRKRRIEFDYDSVYGSLKDTKYYGKCPDMRVGDKWYEYESYRSENPKNAFRNMLSHGLRKSDRLVIKRPKLGWRYMLRSVLNRVTAGQAITEIWLFDGQSLEILYKKPEADHNGQPPLATNR